VIVFHAGTKATDGKFYTAGGRVLAVTATAEKLEDAISKAVAGVQYVSFEGMHYRKDIGHRYKAVCLSFSLIDNNAS
jgi:phosphoribosylamine--glycine ligase